MVEKNIVGVDVGGTKINFGIVNNGVVIRKLKVDTPARENKEVIIQSIISGIEKLTGETEFIGIGIGVPGLLDEEKGIVYNVTNIPSWDEVHLKDSISSYFNKETYLTNDANCYVLGEKLFGKGTAHDNIVGVTLGTGLGAGIIIKNQLHSGLFSCAGELASIPYKAHNFEYYCSGQFFKKEKKISGKELFTQATLGDEKALDIFNEFGRNVGNLVKMILCFLSPEAIFFGGSIVEAKAYFHQGLMEEVNTFPYDMVKNKLMLDYSNMSDAAILGAVALYKFRQKQVDIQSDKVISYI